MKKLIAVSILLTLLTAGVFAQFTIGVTADFYPNLLKTTTPTGDFADDTNANYKGAGTFDVFSTDGPFKGNELRLKLGYTDPDKKYGGLLVIKGDAFLNRDSDYFNATQKFDTDGNKIEEGATEKQSILNFFAQPFDEWNVWGEVGVFKGFAGTTADRGSGAGNARYNDPFSIFLDNFWMSNNGILIPDGTIDTFNLGKFAAVWSDGKTPPTPLYKDSGEPYVSVTANLAPLKVAVSGDLRSVAPSADTTYAPFQGSNNVGAAVRVSGEKIADLVSLDAIYKIYGGDPFTDDQYSGIDQPNGEGWWGHNFGLIANASLFDTLGITAGYSGYVVTQEKKTDGDVIYWYPYYNGVDLRFAFTGVDKLLVSLNNNISFSTFKGDDDAARTPVGITGTYPGWVDDTDVSAGYLGLYNALGVKYNITDSLSATLNLANRLRSTTVTNEITDTFTTTVTKNIFRAYAGAGYAFGSHVLLETGLVFDIDSTIRDVSNATADSYNGGTFTFAIPIRFKVAF